MITIDTTNLCSHLQKKLLDADGVYHPIWTAMQDDHELTAVVRSRQLHVYRNGKKVLVLAGKAAPKIIREDVIIEFLPDVQKQIERIKQMELHFTKAFAAIQTAKTLGEVKSVENDISELNDYYGSDEWKQDFADDEAGRLPKDLRRGVLSEDGLWNLLSDYKEKIEVLP